MTTAALPKEPPGMSAGWAEEWRAALDELMGRVHFVFEEWRWRNQRLALATLLEDLAAEIREEMACPAATAETPPGSTETTKESKGTKPCPRSHVHGPTAPSSMAKC